MIEKLQSVLKKKYKLFKDKPRYFYLNTSRIFAGVLFWIFTLLPFYSENANKYNVFVLKIPYVYFIGLLAIPLLIGFYAYKEDKKNLKLIVIVTAFLQVMFMAIMLLQFFSADVSDTVGNTYKLEIGFYILSIIAIIILFLSFLPNLVVKIIVKIFKIKKKDVIEADVVKIKKID